MPPHRFQPGQSGNPAGRKKGSKNKRPSGAVALQVVDACGKDYLAFMREMARSEHKCDRQWFAEEFRKLLPKDDTLTLAGPAADLAPLARRFLERENDRAGTA